MVRILLIEDNDPRRAVIAGLLADAGYDVQEAATGAVGLQFWHAHGADLVLTAIHMPETSGIEVMLELRTFAPALPIIAMSGQNPFRDLELLRDAHLLGTVGILQNPFTLAELLAAIAAVRPSELGEGETRSA